SSLKSAKTSSRGKPVRESGRRCLRACSRKRKSSSTVRQSPSGTESFSGLDMRLPRRRSARWRIEVGAGEGNRTLVLSMGGSCLATRRHPPRAEFYYSPAAKGTQEFSGLNAAIKG